jgi:hypothetical protein
MAKRVTETRKEAKHTLLRAGDLIPHFDGMTIDGRRVRYQELWQHRNLVLFVLSKAVRAQANAYLTMLEGRISRLRPDDTTLVIRHDEINGVPWSAVIVADRWGEIAYLQQLTRNPVEWPPVDDIVEWVEFIRVKCPECP